MFLGTKVVIALSTGAGIVFMVIILITLIMIRWMKKYLREKVSGSVLYLNLVITFDAFSVYFIVIELYCSTLVLG